MSALVCLFLPALLAICASATLPDPPGSYTPTIEGNNNNICLITCMKQGGIYNVADMCSLKTASYLASCDCGDEWKEFQGKYGSMCPSVFDLSSTISMSKSTTEAMTTTATTTMNAYPSGNQSDQPGVHPTSSSVPNITSSTEKSTVSTEDSKIPPTVTGSLWEGNALDSEMTAKRWVILVVVSCTVLGGAGLLGAIWAYRSWRMGYWFGRGQNRSGDNE